MAHTNFSVVPDGEPKRDTALILIDLINDFDYEGGDRVLSGARQALPAIQRLLRIAPERGWAVIWVNDNFGRWRSRFDEVYDHCTGSKAKGRDLVLSLRPRDEHYLILKPGHSGFHGTPLDPILEELGTETLVLCGLLVNSCVLFTAHEAHMRGFELKIPSDAVIGLDEEDVPQMIGQMEKMFQADTRPAAEL